MKTIVDLIHDYENVSYHYCNFVDLSLMSLSEALKACPKLNIHVMKKIFLLLVPLGILRGKVAMHLSAFSQRTNHIDTALRIPLKKHHLLLSPSPFLSAFLLTSAILQITSTFRSFPAFSFSFTSSVMVTTDITS